MGDEVKVVINSIGFEYLEQRTMGTATKAEALTLAGVSVEFTAGVRGMNLAGSLSINEDEWSALGPILDAIRERITEAITVRPGG